MIKSPSARIGWVDALKGFTILMVVLGHVLQRYYDDDKLIVRIIYSFHIPLFMFLSGYVSYKVSSWANIRKRGIQLLIPFFSAIVLSYLIHDFPAYSFAGLFKSIGNVILRPDTGLWFLWALFFINAIFIGCCKLSMLIHFFILSLLSSAEFFHTAPTCMAIPILWIATAAISYLITVVCRQNRFTQLLILGNNTFGKNN